MSFIFHPLAFESYFSQKLLLVSEFRSLGSASGARLNFHQCSFSMTDRDLVRCIEERKAETRTQQFDDVVTMKLSGILRLKCWIARLRPTFRFFSGPNVVYIYQYVKRLLTTQVAPPAWFMSHANMSRKIARDEIKEKKFVNNVVLMRFYEFRRPGVGFCVSFGGRRDPIPHAPEFALRNRSLSTPFPNVFWTIRWFALFSRRLTFSFNW